MKRSRVYVLCQILGWFIQCAGNLVFASLGPPLHWRLVTIFCWGACCGVFCTHMLRAYIRRNGWLALPPGRALPLVLAASLIGGLAITALVTIAWPFTFGLQALLKGGTAWILPTVSVWSICVFIWLLMYFGAHYFEQFEHSEIEKLRLEVVAKDAQLRALLTQVNPHFLFNSLNSLRALIMEDPPRAQTMVTELASILRYSLQSGDAPTVSLEAEIEAVTAYLKLEGIRLEERLRIRMEVDPASLHVRIPPMLIQTLVENGVKHGVARLPEGGEIGVASQMDPGALKIQVRNSGQLRETDGSTRMGLANARERLQLIYGVAASLALRNDGLHSVIAEISVPLVKATG